MVRAIECAQVTYQAQDLDEMERFLTAFGFEKAEGSTWGCPQIVDT